MVELVPRVRAPSPLEKRPARVTTEQVLGWLRALCGYGDGSYIEIAAAIADASSDDPLFEGPAGAATTAALLTTLAITTSGLHPTLVSRNGRAFGLFQIEVHTADLSADPFLLPRSAAYCAIELLRQQLSSAERGAPIEALRWYGEPAWRTHERLALTETLLLAA